MSLDRIIGGPVFGDLLSCPDKNGSQTGQSRLGGFPGWFSWGKQELAIGWWGNWGARCTMVQWLHLGWDLPALGVTSALGRKPPLPCSDFLVWVLLEGLFGEYVCMFFSRLLFGKSKLWFGLFKRLSHCVFTRVFDPHPSTWLGQNPASDFGTYLFLGWEDSAVVAF